MRRLFQIIFSLLGVISLFNVIKIIYNDFDRLTEYGFGYLFGKIILSIVLLALPFVIRKRKVIIE